MLTKTQLNSVKGWFQNYSNTYRNDKNLEQLNIELKYDHILRVSEEIKDIGFHCQLNDGELRLVEIMALLHDIGRYKQYAIYKTFSDKRSEDHARLGLKVIEENQVLQDFDAHDVSLIKTAIENHNKKKIPHTVLGEHLFYSKILRDADKIDIYKVVTDYYENENPDNKTLQLDLPDIQDIRKQNIDDLMNENVISIENLYTLNDFKLLQIGWIYDINFPRTYEIIKERRYLEKIFQTIPCDETLAEAKRKIMNYLDEKALANAG